MATIIDVDLPRALERLGGDREILAKLIDFVTEDSPALIVNIESALADERFGEVERHAHSLKGLVSNVNCDAVQRQALLVEDSARRHSSAEIVSALDDLRPLLVSMIALLEKARQEINAPEQL